MKILVVIDVHVPYVLETDSGIIDSVAKTVQHVHDGGDSFVCLVEHRSSRPVKPTHAAVSNIVSNDANWERLMKDVWSAAPVVQDMLERRKLTPTEFVVCGAVAHECVIETLQGLRKLYPAVAITLVTTACLSASETPYDWTSAKDSLNVNLVERLSS